MLRSPPWRSLSSFRSLAIRGPHQLLDVPKLTYFKKTTVKLVKVQAQLLPVLLSYFPVGISTSKRL